ncbi:MAG: N-formylglutamate amidohydrolase [Cyclobacteriaceae bacterium]
MEKLPVLLSIPHGGTHIPEEIADKVCLDKSDIFHNSDTCTIELFDHQQSVAEIVSTDISSAIVDVDRAKTAMPPQEADGVIKFKTARGKSIYCEDFAPDQELINKLIENYYEPYHRKIAYCLKEKVVKLAIDCHTLDTIAPENAEDANQPRPLISLGNVHGQSCDYEILERLADCIQVTFNIGDMDVAINKPTDGGYITKKYGNNPIPFIFLGINKSLFLQDAYFDANQLKVKASRIEDLKNRFYNSLSLFSKVVMSKL